MSDRAKTPLLPPSPNSEMDAIRTVARVGLGAVPVLGLVLAEIGNAVIPDPTARDRERWEGEITDDVNELDTRVLDLQGAVTPQKESLSDAAALIAKLMVETCPDGLAHTSVNSSVVRWNTLAYLKTTFWKLLVIWNTLALLSRITQSAGRLNTT